MKKARNILEIVFILILVCSCKSNNSHLKDSDLKNATIKYLALGDSYTIGESVCKSCGFPIQLKDSLQKIFPKDLISVKVIAQTGWTTRNLISAINTENPDSNYDLVTLLIGVNNQYQNKAFSQYEQEFPELLNKAIALAKGNKKNVIVISIPDYAFTPFGQRKSNPLNISAEIDRYNSFAKKYCETKGVQFVNITDITKQGLRNVSLVAEDGLHPSIVAYSKFVDKLIPIAKSILK